MNYEHADTLSAKYLYKVFQTESWNSVDYPYFWFDVTCVAYLRPDVAACCASFKGGCRSIPNNVETWKGNFAQKSINITILKTIFSSLVTTSLITKGCSGNGELGDVPSVCFGCKQEVFKGKVKWKKKLLKLKRCINKHNANKHKIVYSHVVYYPNFTLLSYLYNPSLMLI